MKIIFIVPLLWMAGLVCQGQTSEGKITYERKTNIHKRMPPEAEQWKAMIPEFQTSIIELYFNATQSLVKPAKNQGDQLPSTDGAGGGMRGGFFMRMGGMQDNTETFRDYDKELMIESRELGPKRYLLDDTLRPLKWKLEDETMTIAGFECRKATTTVQGFGMMPGGMRLGGGSSSQGSGGEAGSRTRRTEGQEGGERRSEGQGAARSSWQTMMTEPQTVVAWYTEQIETTAGPDNYFGLPGLILYLDIDDGTIVYTPVKLEPLGKESVKAPTNGKKITREEYREMMQRQMQNMGGRPGAGSFMMRQ